MKRDIMHQRYPGLFEALGTVPDADLAVEYGISAARICVFRKKHKIPPAGQRRWPAEAEWEALCKLPGEITISEDRRSVTYNGCVIRGRTLRYAVLYVLRSAR